HLINPRENLGFARACNYGARQAFGKYLCFLNPDCILTAGTLSGLRAALEADEKAWLAGPRLLFENGREQPGGRRRLPTVANLLSESFKLYMHFPFSSRWQRLNMHEDPLPNHITPVPVISGACML